MIPAEKMIEKMGKSSFAEFATRQKGKRLVDHEKSRRWGRGTVNFRICEHNKVTIRNGRETKECNPCQSSTGVTKTKDFEPHFNLGLGGYVESKSDMNRAAKQAGLIPIGMDRLK